MRLLVVGILLTARIASAQVWQDATAECLGTTAEWSNKLELADIDGDGLPDILVANGGNYSSKGPAEPARIWKNLGNWDTTGVAHCLEVSATAVLGFTGNSRMIKVADVDGDGKLDILTGGAYQTQLKLFSNGVDISANLPQQPTSIGDAEFGDVDGDGDLDIVLADWGPTVSTGGRTRLYLNDGTGHFTEATTTNMPDQIVKWSWDLTLADVDNDFDLDILVSSKSSPQSFLFINDGSGHFTNAPNGLPHFTNNYALEPMDVDGDGYIDLATINDGTGGTNHLFMNNKDGTFSDGTAARLLDNPQADDNAAVFLDVDSDGDADMLVGSLSGRDRLLINDGTGHFNISPSFATPDDTPGTLGIAVADLNGDGRLDVVQSQGEVAFPEKVQLASNLVAVDTQPPVIATEQAHYPNTKVHARVHDHKSPLHLEDFKDVTLKQGSTSVPMKWYGEYLWQAELPQLDGTYQVCATDRAGNHACGDPVEYGVPLNDDTPAIDAPGTTPDAPTAKTQPGGCCDAHGQPSSLLLALALAFSARNRRKNRRCRTAPRRHPSA